MKKLILPFALLSLVSPAFASKARLEALGQDGKRGSFYIEDYRSVFYNPSYLNLKKNALITEWGKASDQEDTDSAPHAEGGIFGDYGSFTFGAYFGSELDSHNEYKNDKFVGQDNRLDFFFAGDAGMLWGLRAFYADSVDETSGVKKTNSAYGLGLGVIMGSLEAYADLGLKDLSTGADAADDKWDGELSIRAGAVYHLNTFTFRGELRNFSFKQTVGSASDDGKLRTIEFSLGREYAVNKTAKIFSDLSVIYQDDSFTGVSFSDVKGYKLPVNLAFETDLNEWLQARGSVSHTIFSRLEYADKKSSDRNSTEVAAGLRYHSGKFNLDGIVGQDSSGNKKGTFGTVSRVAVEYLF